MTDPVDTPAPLPANAPAVARRPWRAGLRWFLAEFVVVVAGVLTALAVSGWAEDRRDRGREQAYLQQLRTDLAASETGMQEGVDFHRQRAEAAARVLHRFWQTAPSVDAELVRDISLPRGSQRFRPILGTAEALIATGDLNLVRADTLRAAILAHLESSRAILADIERYDETYYRPAVAGLNEGPDFIPFVTFISTDYAILPRPKNPERVPFPVELADFLRDRRVYEGYMQLLIAHRNLSARYQDLHDEARALKTRVDAQRD
jgi:hypothetical protein